MQHKKKLLTTLTLTILTLSMVLATIPMVNAAVSKPMLNPATGPVGTKVAVNGTGANPFGAVNVYWETTAGTLLNTAAADSTGFFSCEIYIPSATNGSHFVVVQDSLGATNGTAFTVLPSLKASTTPPTADFAPPFYNAKVLPGDPLTLTGHGFSASSAITVNFTGPAGNITLAAPTITTNATGSFSAVVTVPAIAVGNYGDYNVTAFDASNVTAKALILVDYYITVFPPLGPPGITIWMVGRIPASTAYSLIIDTTTILTGTSGTDGSFFQTYTLPALIGIGVHTIYVQWTVPTIENRSVSFTVTSPPTVSFTPTSGVAGTVVTISGSGFSGFANITLYLGTTVVNSTQLDSRFGPTDWFGAFTNLKFTVPAITPGVYVLTVTDQYGASTGTVYTFTVLPTAVTTIAPRATSYMQGDTISFTITSTDTTFASPAITIKDPNGVVFWTNTLTPWTVTTIGVTLQVLYQDQLVNGNPLTLPADAPLGSWNWTVTYTIATVAKKATGLFTVVERPTLATILSRIDELNVTLSGLITDAEGNLAVLIETKIGTVLASLEDIDAKIEVLDLGDVATLTTTVGTIKTSVDSIGLKVTSIADGVVTIETALGTIEGKVTSIDGNVATIETDVGTITADISGIQEDVSEIPTEAKIPAGLTMAVYVAVIFAVIAAIAAIYSIIELRRKIA